MNMNQMNSNEGANAAALEAGLKRAHGAVAALALPRHGRVLQAELFGESAAAARCKLVRLKPFLFCIGRNKRA